MTTSDSALLSTFCGSRDAAAFTELVSRHAAMVHAVCRRILHDPGLAQDATQETFIQLMRRPPPQQGNLAGWLHRVATGKATDLVRREAALRERHRLATQVSVREITDWVELSHAIDQSLLELDETQRVLLIRHYLQGCSQSDLAAETGQSQATISRRLGEAVETLRERLRRRDIVVAPALLVAGLGSDAAAPLPPAVAGELGKLAIAGVVPAVGSTAWSGTVIVACLAILVAAGAIAAFSGHDQGPVTPSMAASPVVQGAAPASAPPPPALTAVVVAEIMPELDVADAPRAMLTYRDVLGFRIDYLWTGATYAGLSWHGRRLALIQRARPMPLRCCVLLEPASDLDALHDQLRISGATILEPPADQGWGMRRFTVVDADGNHLAMAVPLDNAPTGDRQPARPVRFIPELVVRDQAVAQAFYRDALGFTIDWTWQGTRASVTRGQATLHLVTSAEPDVGRTTILLGAETDVDALCEQMRRAGAAITRAPADMPWGMREFALTDPDGNGFRIGKRIDGR